MPSDALDAAIAAHEVAWQELWNARLVFGGQRQPSKLVEKVNATRAAVRQAASEMPRAETRGEVLEMIVSADHGGYPAILLEKWHNLKPGTRVRVLRVEEAP